MNWGIFLLVGLLELVHAQDEPWERLQQPRHQLFFGSEAAHRHMLVAVGVADVSENEQW